MVQRGYAQQVIATIAKPNATGKLFYDPERMAQYGVTPSMFTDLWQNVPLDPKLPKADSMARERMILLNTPYDQLRERHQQQMRAGMIPSDDADRLQRGEPVDTEGRPLPPRYLEFDTRGIRNLFKTPTTPIPMDRFAPGGAGTLGIDKLNLGGQ
jgi:hypothetical protein